MARVTLCDRCGKATTADKGRIEIWKHKCKWLYFEVFPRYEDETMFLCGDCAKSFKEWLKRKEK